MFVTRYYIYILVFIFFVLLSIQTIITKVVPKEEKYEIFYEGKEPKVIITTYEGKYLIMDGYINQKELTIYTEKYKLIDINEVEFIEYKNFNNVNVFTKKCEINNLIVNDRLLKEKKALFYELIIILDSIVSIKGV